MKRNNLVISSYTSNESAISSLIGKALQQHCLAYRNNPDID